MKELRIPRVFIWAKLEPWRRASQCFWNVDGRLVCTPVVGVQLMKFQVGGYFPSVHLLSRFPNLAEVMLDSPSILGSQPFFFIFVVGCFIAFSHPVSIYMHILQMNCFKIVNETEFNKCNFAFSHNSFKNAVCSWNLCNSNASADECVACLPASVALPRNSMAGSA